MATVFEKDTEFKDTNNAFSAISISDDSSSDDFSFESEDVGEATERRQTENKINESKSILQPGKPAA